VNLLTEDLTVIVSEEAAGIQTYCPELEISAFGRTLEGALKTLREKIAYSLDEPSADITWRLLYPDEITD